MQFGLGALLGAVLGGLGVYFFYAKAIAHGKKVVSAFEQAGKDLKAGL